MATKTKYYKEELIAKTIDASSTKNSQINKYLAIINFLNFCFIEDIKNLNLINRKKARKELIEFYNNVYNTAIEEINSQGYSLNPDGFKRNIENLGLNLK